MNDRPSSSTFSNEEIEFLKTAAHFFKDPGLFVKGMNWLAKPMEYLQDRLPVTVRNRVTGISRAAIQGALQLSLKTLPDSVPKHSFVKATQNSQWSCRLHKGLVTTAGGLGGFFGLATLPIELPIVTVMLLRLIADISRQYGNDITTIESQLECLYVLSLGSTSSNEESLELYYTSRISFAELQRNAMTFIASKTAKEILIAIESKTAPALVRLIAEIAAQYEIRVIRKLLMQTVPIAGAIGGGTLNYLYANYFGEYAKYHFGLKRLEKIHGFEQTRTLFESYKSECIHANTVSQRANSLPS